MADDGRGGGARPLRVSREPVGVALLSASRLSKASVRASNLDVDESTPGDGLAAGGLGLVERIALSSLSPPSLLGSQGTLVGHGRLLTSMDRNGPCKSL